MRQSGRTGACKLGGRLRTIAVGWTSRGDEGNWPPTQNRSRGGCIAWPAGNRTDRPCGASVGQSPRSRLAPCPGSEGKSQKVLHTSCTPRKTGGQAAWPNPMFLLARLAGFEPATVGLEVRCSIHLSYRRPPAETRLDSRDFSRLSTHFSPPSQGAGGSSRPVSAAGVAPKKSALCNRPTPSYHAALVLIAAPQPTAIESFSQQGVTHEPHHSLDLPSGRDLLPHSGRDPPGSAQRLDPGDTRSAHRRLQRRRRYEAPAQLTRLSHRIARRAAASAPPPWYRRLAGKSRRRAIGRLPNAAIASVPW